VIIVGSALEKEGMRGTGIGEGEEEQKDEISQFHVQ